MAKLDLWPLFVTTVEGRNSTASCLWSNGEPAFCPEPIPKDANPNLKLLADMVRSDTPIPAHVRLWLADMIDPDAASEFQFKKLARRGRGARRVGTPSNWEAAHDVKALMAIGATRQRAIGAVINRTGLSESTIEAALRSLNAAEDEHSRQNREHEENERAERIGQALAHPK